MFTNRFDNCKSIWVISVQYQSDYSILFYSILFYSRLDLVFYSRNEKRYENGFSGIDSHLRGDRYKSTTSWYLHSLHVGWRNMCELPVFLRESSVSCYLLCYSRLCTFYQRISDSLFMILKNNWPNLLGLCHFPLNTQSAGMHRWDRMMN